MKLRTPRQRLVGLALVLALLTTMGLGSASGLATTEQDVLINGNFEGGFTYQAGCGAVGAGWGCFTNGGTIDYGFYDDQWASVVADGTHSQLIELNTMKYAASEADRYAGIFQTVNVKPGAQYTLKLSGLMREQNRDTSEDAYRYRIQWGYTVNGSTDWTTVGNWQELSWDKIDERTSPTGMESFTTTFAAPSDKITLFVRVWKKWGTVYKELDVNLDAITLTGKIAKPPAPCDPTIKLPPGGDKIPPEKPGSPGVTVAPVCGGASLLRNGDFESGFTNGVGTSWVSFTNGGRAGYGFYDEQWAKVIKDGKHGQLIEINTKGLAASDADRFAGIYQVVDRLTPGATYEFSLYGMLREEAAHPGEDMYRYRVQWGYAVADADPSATDITNWTEISWNTIYTRTAPGAMSAFSAKLQAPGCQIVLAVRAWKKWGTPYRELDVNLDAIKLVPCVACSTGCHDGPADCIYVVQRGDTLGAIAKRFHTTIAELVRLNGLKNPNRLAIGQKLLLPCGIRPLVERPPVVEPRVEKPPVVEPPKPAAGECVWVVVQSGDTVSGLAAKYNSTVQLIVEKNGLQDANRIYVGQKLCICDP